jgi:hypothetical protein
VTTLERIIDLLPYYLQNGENINKYYSLITQMYDEILNVFLDIVDSRDIDKSELYGLDIIGQIVGENDRNIKDDELFRNNVKTKIIQNNSRGYIEDINQLSRIFLGENFINTKEGWHNEEVENEPAMLEVNLSANKIESQTIDRSKRNLVCGTVATGTTSLGCGIMAITKENIIRKYKPIFIPNLELAAAIGVRLQYRVKNNREDINIKETPKIKFNGSKKDINIKETPNLKFSNAESINISSNIDYFIPKQIQCGTTSISARMGVLL